jgi:hypothetical protein
LYRFADCLSSPWLLTPTSSFIAVCPFCMENIIYLGSAVLVTKCAHIKLFLRPWNYFNSYSLLIFLI